MENKYQEALTNLFCNYCKRCDDQNNCSNCTIRLSKNVLQELIDKYSELEEELYEAYGYLTYDLANIMDIKRK